MKDFVYEPVELRRTYSVIIISFIVSFFAASAHDISAAMSFIFSWVMFLLGWKGFSTKRIETEQEKLTWEQYEGSDWRQFEHLQDLTGAELEELRGLCKNPGQLNLALDWLIKRDDISRDYAKRVHEFFVRSSWASYGCISEEWEGWSWSSNKLGPTKA